MDAEARLIAEAVVTYADSCTLPMLSPGCPYYRFEDGAPTCAEECRALAERLGVEGRGRHTAQVGGLVMHGRAIPLRVAGGTRDYDATRAYITDRDKQPREQSTASLLRSLTNALVANSIVGDISRLDAALRLWGEAERRIGALDAVFRSGVAEQVAAAIVVRVALEHMHRSGRIDIADVLGTPASTESNNWLEAASLSAENVASRPTRRNIMESPDKSILRGALPQLFDTEEELDELVADPVIAHSLTEVFRRRVVRWLSNLLPVDLTGTLSARPPHASLFAALEPAPARDSIGLWLWERFTVTRVDEWSAGSLALEWDWVANGREVPCDSRAMAERLVDADTTSRLAMVRSLRAYSRLERPHGFDSSEYTLRASKLLVSGRWDEASKIFEGLVELSPGDADAWNNLGFCQLAADPAASIAMLRRAEALSRTPSILTAANLSLALHLAGKDDDALRLGRVALSWESPNHSESAWLWEHPAADRDAHLQAELVLGDFPSVRDYLSDLLKHIEGASTGGCQYLPVDADA